jgi:predicted metal-binding protein
LERGLDEYFYYLEIRMIDLDYLTQKTREFGVAASAIINTVDIQFVSDFRKSCEMNTCGNFGKNWMCPPAVGSIEELQTKVLELSQGIVVQTVYQLQDSFDFEGMQKAGTNHEKIFRSILDYIQSNVNYRTLLPLNVGACKFCQECSCPTGEPCRFPDKAVASLEAHCIDVNALLTKYDIPYNNGPNTVSFVSLFLLS